MRRLSVGSETTKHEMDHGCVDHRSAGFDQQFVVATETAIATEPGESALDHPAKRQAFETLHGRVTFDDFQLDMGIRTHVCDEVFASVNPIGPQLLEPWETRRQERGPVGSEVDGLVCDKIGFGFVMLVGLWSNYNGLTYIRAGVLARFCKT